MPRRAAPSLRKLLPEALSEQRIQIGSSLPPRLGSAPHQIPGSGWWHAVYRWGRGSPWGHAAVSRSGASCLRGNFRTNGPGARPTKSWPTNPPTTSEIQLSWQRRSTSEKAIQQTKERTQKVPVCESMLKATICKSAKRMHAPMCHSIRHVRP